MSLAKQIIERFERVDLNEMANFYKGDFGQPMNIWIDGDLRSRRHGPRIKVQANYSRRLQFSKKSDYFSVSISDNPEIKAGSTGRVKNSDIKLIFKFVKLNKDVLLEYGKGKMMSDILIQKLKSI